ncbi:MAG: hypothetical protein E5V92_08260 [Mesorhizobium sp.]|nr:MAG: hypothetical protein E5V92_08260 [Mesorhizobium sp.]
MPPPCAPYSQMMAASRICPPRAFQRFIESPNRSKYLFLRNSGRKTGTHFSWNCSKAGCRS